MSKVLINDSVGLETIANGSGLQVDVATTFATSPTATVSSITSATTLTAGGVYTVSGNSAVGVVMPLASVCPGAMFTFRSLSAQAHYVTGSQETNGTKVFAVLSGTLGASAVDSGSNVALGATVGNAISLVSDGASFLVLGGRGAFTVSGT